MREIIRNYELEISDTNVFCGLQKNLLKKVPKKCIYAMGHAPLSILMYF